MYEKKDGQFACFMKKSKAGKIYFNGDVKLYGKDYWVSVFEKVTVKGDRYLSGVIEEKKGQQKPVEQDEKENDEWIEDPIPF